jgi:hypothetical protein
MKPTVIWLQQTEIQTLLVKTQVKEPATDITRTLTTSNLLIRQLI